MKIFTWVHRKFHHKDGFGGNVKKKPELIPNETESQLLLEPVVTFVDVLDGWRDGILAIGTFGFGPLIDSNRRNECPVIEKEEECDEEEYPELDDENYMKECDEEEVNPPVFAAFRGGFDEGIGSIVCGENALKTDMAMPVYGTTHLSPRPYELGFEYSNEPKYDKEGKKRKERTTLEDLFIADSNLNTKRDPGKLQPDSSKKPDLHAKKKGLSFSKKLIPLPRVGDDTRPIKKLHQLMRRMLKRKIHPDLEGKIQKGDSQIKPTVCGLVADEYGANESVSLLLQSQDAIV